MPAFIKQEENYGLIEERTATKAFIQHAGYQTAAPPDGT